MARPETVASRLTVWFPRAARDLSWRRTRDPYAIWVSEIMLQQTRVDTVEGYYGAFLTRFPTVERLADASEDEVLEAWSGLGYYRRARLLHRGARHVSENLGGRLPDEAAALRDIPGIGPYTAGAIASIAYDRPTPLVDGNVARVSSRLRAVEDPKLQDASAKAHWKFVAEIMAHGSPRLLSQALMELGALVCTPRNPQCSLCPVRRSCKARAHDLQAKIPAPKVKAKSPETRYVALAIRWGQKILLERRPGSGLLAGLWCLPLIEHAGDDAPVEQAEQEFGVALRFEASPTKSLRHVFTHRVWDLAPWGCRASRRPRVRRREDGREFCWVAPGELPTGGIPSVTRKLLARLKF